MPVSTGSDGSLTGVLRYYIVNSMLILDRDRLIVLSIGRFGQLTFEHLRIMHFSGLASDTPLKRALIRLRGSGHVKVIERRLVGGSGAGSGQYVYQLGSAGWSLTRRQGKYWPFRTVDYHTLGIADAYVELLKLEQAGRARLDGFATEPDSWALIAGADLRPDLHVDVADLGRRRNTSLWIEIDMGTERQKAIKDKLARYWHAYQHATEKDLPSFPLILFIAPDDARARELRWIIERGHKDAQDLFLVSTMPQFVGLMFG
jgi:hypothetical protein